MKKFLSIISMLIVCATVYAQQNNEIQYRLSRDVNDEQGGIFNDNPHKSKSPGDIIYEFTFETDLWSETWDSINRTVNFEKVRELDFKFVDLDTLGFTKVGQIGYYTSPSRSKPNTNARQTKI